MKTIEAKNHLALETAKLIFQDNKEVTFIGGTALNAFYLNYRYSEDLDLGYPNLNQKTFVEKTLRSAGYSVETTALKFRDIISLDGVSIKLDVIEHKPKYNGLNEVSLGTTSIRTLKIEEFFVEKAISFFTREERTGLIRDAYDLFSIDQKFGSLRSLIKDIKPTIQKNIVTLDLNFNLFKNNLNQAQECMQAYLKRPINAEAVLEFLVRLKGGLRG